MEKEVIEGSELRQILELYDPGPRLVPGSVAVDGADEEANGQAQTVLVERPRRAEDG
jgi:hypothetical protein